MTQDRLEFGNLGMQRKKAGGLTGQVSHVWQLVDVDDMFLESLRERSAEDISVVIRTDEVDVN